jgi:thioredoxin reductase (NADPH)
MEKSKVSTQPVDTLTQHHVNYDLIIIGGGISGLSAALIAKNKGLDTLVLEKSILGGTLLSIPQLEDFPFMSGSALSGQSVIDSILPRIKAENINVSYEEVLEVSSIEKQKKVVTTQHTYFSRSVIVATGAQSDPLGLPGEIQFLGLGISQAFPCDIEVFRGKTIAVISDENRAGRIIPYLSSYVKKIYFISSNLNMNLSHECLSKIKLCSNVEMLTQHKVQEFIGENWLESIQVQNLHNQKVAYYDVQGAFLYGHRQGVSSFCRGLTVNDELSYICTDKNLETKTEGLYAIGDVRSSFPKAILVAASDALCSVTNAAQYIFLNR